MRNPFSFAFLLLAAPVFSQTSGTSFLVSDLKKDQITTEQLLIRSLETEQFDAARQLLTIYQDFPQANHKLLAYADMKLAQNDLSHYHYQEARQRFFAIKEKYSLHPSDIEVVDQFIDVVNQRDSWQFDFNAYYLQTKNVNNASDIRHIENTGFIKNDEMLPKSAHGIAYNGSASRNWQIIGSHFVHFSNDLFGKFYWDNHEYDEMTNRSYLGYVYQTDDHRWSIKPFYERQWVGNHRYSWGKGVRTEWQQSFTKKWQLSTALEWSGQRYFYQPEKDGTIKLISATLFWIPTEKSYFYVGTDFIREKTIERQYSNDTKFIRLGMFYALPKQINLHINGSIAHRKFKDEAMLAGIFPLSKIRRDHIYSANFTLWKADWNWKGFTPKVQFKWKKQKSNLDTMYSYSEKSAQLIIEKTF